MRIQPASFTEADPDPVVQAVVKRRGGKFIELDRALLVSLPLAEGWNHLIGAVRTRLKLPALYRELAMCGVAVLNGADYEFGQHAPLYLAAGGAPERLDALRRLKTEISEVFTPTERAALALIRAMTLEVELDDETFEAARAAFPDERELVELVAVTAAYNMVSRFLVALKI